MRGFVTEVVPRLNGFCRVTIFIPEYSRSLDGSKVFSEIISCLDTLADLEGIGGVSVSDQVEISASEFYDEVDGEQVYSVVYSIVSKVS